MSEALTVEMLLRGYARGAFPMGDPDTGEIHWFCPDPRAVIEIDRFRPPRSLRQTIRRGRFDVTIDAEFHTVIRRCADRPRTWINDEIIDVYSRLHELGLAHSLETWRDGALAGGLYGVALGGAFFGESMFHHVTDASKVALAALITHLRQRGYALLDIQFMTDHLRRFAAVEIPRSLYLRRLAHALQTRPTFSDGERGEQLGFEFAQTGA